MMFSGTRFQIKKTLALALTAVLLSATALEVAAVEYRYGAIAMNKNTGRTTHSYNHLSIEAAELDAIDRCGVNCKSMLWFRNGCGAIAFGSHGRYGTAIGPSRAAAEVKAIEACGLDSCAVRTWACTAR